QIVDTKARRGPVAAVGAEPRGERVFDDLVRRVVVDALRLRAVLLNGEGKAALRPEERCAFEPAAVLRRIAGRIGLRLPDVVVADVIVAGLRAAIFGAGGGGDARDQRGGKSRCKDVGRLPHRRSARTRARLSATSRPRRVSTAETCLPTSAGSWEFGRRMRPRASVMIG